MTTPTRVEMFYDFSSPYAYLGHEEAQRVVARHGAELLPKPFLLGGLFRALNGPMVPILESSPAKRAMLDRDIHRWAELRGLPLRWPTRFPMNTVLALRVALQLEGEAHLRAMGAIFRAYWGDDVDIADANALGKVLAAAGFDAAGFLAGTGDAAVKDKLRAHGDAALARGAMGAPTFFVGDVMIFGQDRFEHLDRVLGGWRPAKG